MHDLCVALMIVCITLPKILKATYIMVLISKVSLYANQYHVHYLVYLSSVGILSLKKSSVICARKLVSEGTVAFC